MDENFVKELRHHDLLRSLVERRLIQSLVGDQQVESEAITQAKKSFLSKHGLDGDDALGEYLNNVGITIEDFNWQISLPLRINSYCNSHYIHKAEAQFLERKNQLDRVVYTMLRVKNHLLAKELYLRIEAEEADFADLAEFSEGQEKQTRGIVGPVPLTNAHPALAERLRTSTPGELIEPFKILDFWLVVRLESYNSAVFNEMTAVQMARELFNKSIQKEANEVMRNLLAKNSVTVDS